MPDKKLIQRQLRAFLSKQKITQQQFAQYIHKSNITISRWLSSKETGLTNTNIKLIKAFLVLQPGPIKNLCKKTKSTPPTKSLSRISTIEKFRYHVIDNIIQMDQNATKEEIIKQIRQLP